MQVAVDASKVLNPNEFLRNIGMISEKTDHSYGTNINLCAYVALRRCMGDISAAEAAFLTPTTADLCTRDRDEVYKFLKGSGLKAPSEAFIHHALAAFDQILAPRNHAWIDDRQVTQSMAGESELGMLAYVCGVTIVALNVGSKTFDAMAYFPDFNVWGDLRKGLKRSPKHLDPTEYPTLKLTPVQAEMVLARPDSYLIVLQNQHFSATVKVTTADELLLPPKRSASPPEPKVSIAKPKAS